MKISKRLGFVAHRRLGVPLVLPNGDHYKSREDADDGNLKPATSLSRLRRSVRHCRRRGAML
jgi:hypothetical protein